MVLEDPAHAPIDGQMGAWVLRIVAEHAVRLATRQQSGEDPEHEEVGVLSEALLERMPGIPEDAYLGDVGWRVKQLRDFIRWLAEQAGVRSEAQT